MGFRGICYNSDGLIVSEFSSSSGNTTLVKAQERYLDFNVMEDAAGDSVPIEEHYVLAGLIAARSALSATWNKQSIAADGVDEAVLSGLPKPCTVLVDWEPVVVTDGLFEFATDDPGSYHIVVNETAYLYQEWVIDAA